jgi:hypothetical protein
VIAYDGGRHGEAERDCGADERRSHRREGDLPDRGGRAIANLPNKGWPYRMPFNWFGSRNLRQSPAAMLNAPAHTAIASKRRRAVELKDATA